MLAAWAASARPESRPPRTTAAETTATGDVPAPSCRADAGRFPPTEPVGTTHDRRRARGADGPAHGPAVRSGRPRPTPARADDSPTDGARRRSAAPAVAASVSDRSGGRPAVPRPRLRRRSRPGGRPLPSDHPLRRAAVAVVVAALGISGAAASGGTAMPGDPGWAITEVFFAERARSIEAAAGRVRRPGTGPDRAQPRAAATSPSRSSPPSAAALPSVGEEEGHTQLVDQQRMLAGRRGADPAAAHRPEPHHDDDPDPARRARHLGPRRVPRPSATGRPAERRTAGRHRAPDRGRGAPAPPDDTTTDGASHRSTTDGHGRRLPTDRGHRTGTGSHRHGDHRHRDRHRAPAPRPAPAHRHRATGTETGGRRRRRRHDRHRTARPATSRSGTSASGRPTPPARTPARAPDDAGPALPTPSEPHPEPPQPAAPGSRRHARAAP